MRYIMKKIIPIVLFILFSVNLSRSKENKPMGIVLVAAGKVDKRILEELKSDLSKISNRHVSIGKEMPEPDYAFNKKRGQYLASTILDKIAEEKDYVNFEKILGIVDCDLYVPELNFVFGQASSRLALISLTRLRQQYYSLPEDKGIFYKRVLTEAVHELGHTYGLGHCANPDCVMFFSNSIMDTDRKGYQFCPICRKKIDWSSK